MNSILHIPTQLDFGIGSIARFRLPAGPVLVLTGNSLDDETREYVVKSLATDKTDLILLRKPRGEPFSAQIDCVFSDLPRELVAVVGVGGGSVLDFAKAVAILAGSGGKIMDYEFGARKIGTVLPLYLAPTTCGSGSEVTPYCVINNSETGRKSTLNHPALRPVQAAVDPEFLRHLPGPVRLSTGLDAFTHCLEAVLTRAETRLIRPIAEAGLALGWQRIPQATHPEQSSEALVEMAQLSLYGGISIAHSRTGLIHTMSVAFAEFCDLPHGLLNARLLPYALAHNLSGYDGLLRALVQRFSGKTIDSDADALRTLTGWLASLIGAEPPAPGREIRKRLNAIVRRMLQDNGLPGVSHGIIDHKSLTSLIESVADASR